MKQYITQIKRKCSECENTWKCSDESNTKFCSIECLMYANEKIAERGGTKFFEVLPQW